MAINTVFDLDHIRQLDFGRIGAAFNVELERCVRDCMDRPADNRARSVAISFKLRPQSNSTEVVDCDNVLVECEITGAVPKRRTKLYTMTPNRQGKLTFNPDLPDEPEQPTLYDDQERADAAGG